MNTSVLARSVAVFVVASCMISPAQAQTTQSAEYTLGHSEYVEGPFIGRIHTASLCGDLFAGSVRVEGIGGDCGFSVRPSDLVSVVVQDDVLGSLVEFTAIPTQWPGGPVVYCGSASHGVGSLQLVIPAGCNGLAVFVDVGATTGTIVVTS